MLVGQATADYHKQYNNILKVFFLSEAHIATMLMILKVENCKVHRQNDFGGIRVWFKSKLVVITNMTIHCSISHYETRQDISGKPWCVL